MANETPSYTPAQLEIAQQMVGDFLCGRETQLSEAKEIVVGRAALMNKAEGDPTARVLRVANIQDGMIESVSYYLSYGVENRSDGNYGRSVAIRINRGEEYKPAEELLATFDSDFYSSVYEQPLPIVPSVEDAVGEVSWSRGNDVNNMVNVQRIY